MWWVVPEHFHQWPLDTPTTGMPVVSPNYNACQHCKDKIWVAWFSRESYGKPSWFQMEGISDISPFCWAGQNQGQCLSNLRTSQGSRLSEPAAGHRHHSQAAGWDWTCASQGNFEIHPNSPKHQWLGYLFNETPLVNSAWLLLQKFGELWWVEAYCPETKWGTVWEYVSLNPYIADTPTWWSQETKYIHPNLNQDSFPVQL